MVTDISGSALLHSIGSQTGAVATQRGLAPVQSEVERQSGVSVSQSSTGSTASQVAGLYARLQGRQDELNQAASFLREAGSTLDKAAKTLDALEKGLEKIVKIYPPYPLDDPQRVDLLNKLSGLRKEIDSLTFPPPERLNAVGRLLGGGESQAGNLGVDGNAAPGSDPITDIPALDPKSASDKEVSQAYEQVKLLKSVVEDVQSGIWKDVVDFVQKADTPAARNHAAELRDQLARLGFGQGIASDARQLQQAAESN